MYCKQCGKELPNDARFCDGCGTPVQGGPVPNQGGTTPPPPPPRYQTNPTPPPRPQPRPAGSGTSADTQKTLDIVLKIFCGLAAAYYAFQLIQIFPYIISIFDWFGFGVTGLSMILASIFSYLPCAWMLVVLILMIVKRKPSNNDTLFGALAAGALVHLVGMFIGNFMTGIILGYGGFMGISHIFPGFFGCLVVAAIVFGLLYAMGQPPFIGKNADEIKASVMGGLNDITGKGDEDSQNGQSSYQADQTYQKAYQDQPDQGAYQSQFYQNPVTPQGYGNSGRLPTDRSLVTYILLSIITCGIYSYYFLYMLARDVNTVCEGDGQETPGLLPFILLSFVTCGFYALYWYYCLGNRLANNAPRYGLHFQENGTTVLLWYLVGAFLCGIGPYVAMHFLIRNTNSLCAAYNQYNGL